MIPYYKKYVKLIKHPIKKAFRLGYKKEEIESKLKDKHWPKDIIEEAFKTVTTQHAISKKKIILNLLYWLGLIFAILSFLFRDYFIVLISTGIVLMLLSIPLRMSERKDFKKQIEGKKEEKPALSKAAIMPKPKKESFFSRLFKEKPREVKKEQPKKPELPAAVKKESFFSRLFKKKPREVKPEIPKPKKKEQLEKRLVVEKQVMPKSPSLAALLSIIPGLGHFYLGKVKKGLIILLTFWLLIPYIYGFIDAYKLAKEINKRAVPPSVIKKPEEKKKQKKKRKTGLIILLLFSMLAIGLVFYLYFNLPGFTRLNLTTYSTIIILLTLILLPIVKKGRKKDKKDKEDGLPEHKKVKIEQLKREVTRKQGDYETDFDKLHKLVEKYGRIKISDIAETFNISKHEAEEWASILEQHNLATIYYPAIGGPEIVRKRKEKKEEEENA